MVRVFQWLIWTPFTCPGVLLTEQLIGHYILSTWQDLLDFFCCLRAAVFFQIFIRWKNNYKICWAQIILPGPAQRAFRWEGRREDDRVSLILVHYLPRKHYSLLSINSMALSKSLWAMNMSKSSGISLSQPFPAWKKYTKKLNIILCKELIKPHCWLDQEQGNNKEV